MTLLILNSAIIGQVMKLGFRVEPALFFMNKTNKSSNGFSPYSIYLTNIYEPVEWLNIELRPGYLIGFEYYGGFEIGAFARIKILPTNIYVITGFNNHSNTFSSAHNGGGGYTKKIFYKGLGIGYQKDSKLSFDLIYYWAVDKIFAYTFEQNGIGDKINTEMKGILKLGFSLAWDIY